MTSVATICLADNPMVQTMYTADPAPVVHGGVLYAYLGHDEDGTSGWFRMKDWRLFSTTDMANWTDRGSPMSLASFNWAKADAWAGQVVYRNNKFYYYAPMRLTGEPCGIGVGVSEKPEGPFVDAIGKPLVSGVGTIDPTVFVDDDGQAYLYWGNPRLYMVKLNEDMISYSGEITQLPTNASTVNNMYVEGPWVHKRNGLYYLLYSTQNNGTPGKEDIRYSTSPGPTGPWTYRGLVQAVQPGAKSWTNHSGVVDYKENSYFFYHNGDLPGGSDFTRSVGVEQFTYNADGSIPPIPMTKAGPAQIGHLDPFVTTQAETIAFSSGLKTEVCNDDGGGMNVTSVSDGDYVKVKGVDFRTGATSFEARVASTSGGGTIELHLDSLTGPLIGTCAVQGTGGAQTWATKPCPVSGATGVHDLFFKFTGGSGSSLFNFNWWKFSGPGGDGGTTYALRLSKSGNGTVSGPGIACGTTCSASYPSGTSVTLTANPAAGATFTGWGGACTGTGTCTVSMTADQGVTAAFDAVPGATYTLSVAKNGTGTGTVTSAPAGLGCGSNCSGSYSDGASVTLTADADAGSDFAGWSGACTGTGTGTCTVSMTADQRVTATFDAAPGATYTLSVARSGTGTGTVTSAPAGLGCGSSCSGSYSDGASVTLTAGADAGSDFAGWSGACTGTGTCTVSMTADRSVTAIFNAHSATPQPLWSSSGCGTAGAEGFAGVPFLVALLMRRRRSRAPRATNRGA